MAGGNQRITIRCRAIKEPAVKESPSRDQRLSPQNWWAEPAPGVLTATRKSVVTGTIGLPEPLAPAMPELHDRPLGTSPEHKVLHAVAQISTGRR